MQRQLVSVEKLLVHGFPVQEMVFPEKVTDVHIESLGGNTMHLKCVGLAMLMASALVDWGLPQSQLGRRFSRPQAARRPRSAKKGTPGTKRARRSHGSAGSYNGRKRGGPLASGRVRTSARLPSGSSGGVRRRPASAGAKRQRAGSKGSQVVSRWG